MGDAVGYDSSKNEPYVSSRNIFGDSGLDSEKRNLNTVRGMINSYLDVCEKLDETEQAVNTLKRQKVDLEKRMRESSDFERIASMISNLSGMGGPKR